MTILPFHKHHWSHCDCQEGTCMQCGGGLHFCTTCGGFEGGCPEDCPGVQMTEEQYNKVADGELDFRVSQGGWTTWTRSRELHNKGLTL